MGWLKIDDGFEDHPKVELLSNEAHRLWLRAACWCRKTTNQHTNGLVPRALLSVIAKRMAPPGKLLKLAQELVNANAGGAFEHGLWETVGEDWRFHDWDHYQPEPEAKSTMSRSEAARVAGQRSAEVRRQRHGTAQPGSVPNESRTSDARSSNVRPNEVHRTDPERLEPPDPSPLPGPLPGPEDQIHTQPSDSGSVAFGQPEKPMARARDRFLDSFDMPDPEDIWAFERWKTVCDKPDAEPDFKRIQCLRERREAGMTRQDLDDALVGAKADEWATTVHFKITCLFGDVERYEGFRDAGRAIREGKVPTKKPKRGQQPKQPNSGYVPPVEDA